ncbi:MAG TPA: hypothetical protein VGG20_21800, partial [Thermoanaerobaculia bacterium]
GLRYPEIVEPDSDLAGFSFILPGPDSRPEQASAATWPMAGTVLNAVPAPAGEISAERLEQRRLLRVIRPSDGTAGR